MKGLLSKILSRWFAPAAHVDITLRLVDYIQSFLIWGMVKEGLEDDLLDIATKKKPVEILDDRSIALTPERQFFLVSFIAESLLRAGITDGIAASRIIRYVLHEALSVPEDATGEVAMAHLKVFAQLKHAAEDGAGRVSVDERARSIFDAAIKAAERFVASMGDDKAEPSDEDVENFVGPRSATRDAP